MNGDIAETVWALGLGDRVVGVAVSVTYPAGAAAHPKKIGYARDLNAEGVLSLRPTVVVGTEDAGPPEVIDQIDAAGVPLTMVDTATSVDQIPGKIRAVAEAPGVPDVGDRLAARTAGEIDRAAGLANCRGRRLRSEPAGR